MDSRTSRLRRFAAYALGALFIVAGVMHFVAPDAYVAVMPPYIPAPRAMVLVSGVAEIMGGVGLLLPRFRTAAAWGLVLLLVAVFPANVYMAQHPEVLPFAVPAWAVWLRLPLQFVLIALVVWAGIMRSDGRRVRRA